MTTKTQDPLKKYVRAVCANLKHKHGVDVPYTAMRASLVEGIGLNPHALVLKATSQKPRASKYTPVPFQEEGWTELDQVFHCKLSLTVYAQPNLDTPLPSWRYVVTASLPEGKRLLVAEQPFEAVPQRYELETLLIDNGLLDKHPEVYPFEYALNVEFDNPCDSNFLTEALRDRAVDEQFLAHARPDDEWGIEVDDITVTTFCIDSQGDQEQYGDDYIYLDRWLKDRWPEIQKEFELARSKAQVRFADIPCNHDHRGIADGGWYCTDEHCWCSLPGEVAFRQQQAVAAMQKKKDMPHKAL